LYERRTSVTRRRTLQVQPVKWVVQARVGGTGARQGRVERRVEELESERV
jgi:hypothetical protein